MDDRRSGARRGGSGSVLGRHASSIERDTQLCALSRRFPVAKLILILSTLAPIVLTLLALAGLVAVPRRVAAVFRHLDEKQQRFAYDIAKGLADSLDLVKDKTPTRVDDAIASIARQVEEQIGQRLKPRQAAAVAQAVRKVVGKQASVAPLMTGPKP